MESDERDELREEAALLSKTRFLPGDVIIYRTHGCPAREEIERLRAAFPAGVAVIVLRPGEDLEVLPDEATRTLYAHLQRRFGGTRG